jgi:hypothetical protein
MPATYRLEHAIWELLICQLLVMVEVLSNVAAQVVSIYI